MNNTEKKQMPFFDHCFDKNRLKKWITKFYNETIRTEDLTILHFVETLKTIGYQEATRAGVSIGIDDLRIPPAKAHLLKNIEYEVEQTSRDFAMNRLTALENFQNFIDTWHRTSETIKMEVVANFEETDTLNPVYMMAFSGARGNLSQVSQLVGMRGFMSDPEGQIINYPIRSNFREGLTLTEYVISCYGARKGLVDTALRTADAGYLTRRLVDVAHNVIITKFDCKTTQGIWLASMKEGAKTLYPLEKRLVGRVLADDIYFPYVDEETKAKEAIFWSYFSKNQQLDAARAKLLSACFTRVLVRSPLRCLKKKRLCQLCYGWTLPHAHLAPIGEAVGILAAQSIGEPGTQLTMRTFHTGGVFSGALSEDLKAPYSGRIRYGKSIKGALLRASNGQLAFRTKESGQLTIQPLTTNSTETIFNLNFPAASILFLKNLEMVSKGDLLIELPKEQEAGKETVLNTYTYYSKRSGLIKVYKMQTDVNPYEDDDLITHTKLPKIEPFYELAQNINPTLHSFKIYSGQIWKTAQVKRILPQPGDLINTHSLMNRTQLVYPISTILQTPKPSMPFGEKTSLPGLNLQKNILTMPLGKIQYRQDFGYISKLPQSKLGMNFILPTLNPVIQPFHAELFVYFKETRSVTSGKFFYPLIFSKLTDRYVGEEKEIYQNQWINSLSPRITISKLNTLFQFKEHKSPFEQSLFEISEPIYKNFTIHTKQKVKKKYLTIQPRQSKGTLLSKYQTTVYEEGNWIPELDSSEPKWVKNENIICKQFNLQQKPRLAKVKKDGFLVKKPLGNRQHLRLTKKWKNIPSKTYWQTQSKFQLKVGWPYFQPFKQPIIHQHQQFHFFGQTIVPNISFPSQCTYTEYLQQSLDQTYALNKLQTSSFRRQRTNVLFILPKNKYFVLLIRPTNNHSVVQTTLPKQLQTYQKLFYKDVLFEQIQRFQKLPLKNTLKSKAFIPLFHQLNKQSKTTTNIHSLSQQRSCLQMKAFFKKDLPVLTNVNSSNRLPNFANLLYQETHRQSVYLTQCILKIPPNVNFDSMTRGLITDNPLTPHYAYGLGHSLPTQNFFKNGPWDTNALYAFKPRLYSNTKKQVQIPANSPIIQSHFLSPYNGELVVTKTRKDNEVDSLILTSKDTCTISSQFMDRKCQIGDQIYYGMEVTQGESSSQAGQVIHITKTHVKLQLIENSLIASNSRFFCQNNQFIERTTQLFTQSYPRLQMGDIVQGIPKIEEFFEARQTKDGNPFKNNLHNRLRKRFRFYKKNCRYPLFVAARKSIYDIQNYIIDSIFKLYNSQGIDLSDKHLEIIVRQMTSKVKVTQFWKYGTPFVPFKHPLPTELYSRHYVERYQYRQRNTYNYNVRYVPAVLGITRAALENDSFISAASFQETTRILSRGAIFQKKDYLKGLKENVILGHIIPAGTAVRTYSRRFKPPIMMDVLSRQVLQVLTINQEWRLGIVDSTNQSTQYFNPIRRNILRIICLEYFHII